MISQPSPRSQLARIEKEHEEVVRALAKIKETERLLADVKHRMEYMALFANNSIVKRDLKLYKQSKNEFNAFPSFLDAEKILMRAVVPYIKINRNFSEDQQYKRFMANEVLSNSVKIFKEETQLQLKDPHELKNYKSFLRAYEPHAIGMIDISYKQLEKSLEFFVVQKGGFLMIRFEESSKYEDLPDIFFICLVRIDLLTITICCRKIPPRGNKAENEEEDMIVLFNIVYSNLFDPGQNLKFPNQVKPIFVMTKHINENDTALQNLLHLIKKNYDRLAIPCMYPSYGMYQSLSQYVMDKLEMIWKNNSAQLRSKEDKEKYIEQVLSTLTKKYPDEMVEAFDGKCMLCKRKFTHESEMQRMVPAILIRYGPNNEKHGPFHVSCKKLTESKESEEPKVTVEVDAFSVDPISKFFQ